MGVSFSSLQVGLSGLYTSQKALEIANHNIANASTEGYTRQVGNITAFTPQNAYGSGMIGTGSDLSSIDRVRDSYVDYRYWNEAGNLGEWEVKESSLSDFEILFNENEDSGLTKVMNDFYSSMQELSKDSSSLPARVAFKEKVISMAKQFNVMASELKDLQRDYNFGVRSKVDEINSYGKQISTLNEQIYKIEVTGTKANDLRDKRQVLVDKLSKIVDIDVNETRFGTLTNGIEDTRFSISIKGHMLVNHTQSSKIEYIQRTVAQRQNPNDIDGLYSLEWEDGNTFNTEGGELKGYIDARDGNGDTTTGSMNGFKGTPYYMERLNSFVRTFAQGLNEGTGTLDGFEDGYGLDGSTGIKIFTTDGDTSVAFSNYATLTAENISVSADIAGTDGIRLIGLSDSYGESGNANILEDVLTSRHDNTMFAEGAPEDFMKSLIATLAVDSQESKKMSSLQDSIVQNIDNKRESISGVSIDEEMANVVKYQQIYTASAKLISVMDELYKMTINNLGNAGR